MFKIGFVFHKCFLPLLQILKLSKFQWTVFWVRPFFILCLASDAHILFSILFENLILRPPPAVAIFLFLALYVCCLGVVICLIVLHICAGNCTGERDGVLTPFRCDPCSAMWWKDTHAAQAGRVPKAVSFLRIDQQGEQTDIKCLKQACYFFP